jgi:hypothetical protein
VEFLAPLGKTGCRIWSPRVVLLGLQSRFVMRAEVAIQGGDGLRLIPDIRYVKDNSLRYYSSNDASALSSIVPAT